MSLLTLFPGAGATSGGVIGDYYVAASDYGVSASNSAAVNTPLMLAAAKAAIAAGKTLLTPIGDIKCGELIGSSETDNSTTFALNGEMLNIEIPPGSRILRQRGSFWLNVDTSDQCVQYTPTGASFVFGGTLGQSGGQDSNLYQYSRSLRLTVSDASAISKYDRITLVTVPSSGYLVTNDSGDDYGYPVEDLDVLDVNYDLNYVFVALPEYREVTAANTRFYHWPNDRGEGIRVVFNGAAKLDPATGDPESNALANAKEMINVLGSRLILSGFGELYDSDRGLASITRTMDSIVQMVDSARTRNQSVNNGGSGSANDTRKLTYIVDNYANKRLKMGGVTVRGCRHIYTGNTNKTVNRRTISQITLSNPLRLLFGPDQTAFTTGDEVYLDDIGGTVELNETYHTVTAASVTRDVNSILGIDKTTATRSLTTLTQTAGVATATTSVAHDFATGQSVVIGGTVTPSGYAGTFTILSTPTSTTFTYAVDSGLSSPASLTSATAISATSGPVIVNYSGSSIGIFSNGTSVSVAEVVGMTALNGNWYTTANLDTGAKTFELTGTISNALPDWVSGGTVGYVQADLNGVNGTSGYSAFTSGGWAFEVSDWKTNGYAIDAYITDVKGAVNQGAPADTHAGEQNIHFHGVNLTDPVEYFNGLITPKAGNFRGNNNSAANIQCKNVVQCWSFDGFAIDHIGRKHNTYVLETVIIDGQVWQPDQDLFGGAGSATSTTARQGIIRNCSILREVGRICNAPANSGHWIFDNLSINADLARIAATNSSRYLFTNGGGDTILEIRNSTLDFRNSDVLDSTGAVVNPQGTTSNDVLKRFGTLTGNCTVVLDNVRIYGLDKFDARYGLFGTNASGTKTIRHRNLWMDIEDFPIAGVQAAAKTVSAATAANPIVCTSTAHGYTTGDKVFFHQFDQMVELNNTMAVITVINPNSFSIPVDGSGYAAETSGGLAYKITTPVDVTIVQDD